MQQKGEEQDPLFYDLPLPRLLNWNRWWHIVAKTIQLVYKKKTWAAIGSLLKHKKGNYTEGVVTNTAPGEIRLRCWRDFPLWRSGSEMDGCLLSIAALSEEVKARDEGHAAQTSTCD